MKKSLKIIIPISAITIIVIIVVVLILILGKKKSGNGKGPSPGPSPHPPPPPGPGPPGPSPSYIGSYYKEPKYPIKASTTNFASDLTSCACQQDIMNENFNKMEQVDGLYWVGAATPNWMQTPYNGPLNGDEKEPRNCSVGWGGCGNCFELTTTGEKNTDGATTPKGLKLGVIITDNCESSNAANEQWCIPNKQGEKINTPASVWVEKENKTYDLKMPECKPGDFENGICTNKAGYNYHFDVQLQGSKIFTRTDVTTEKNWGVNPIVSAKRIECPQKVLDNMKQSCGKTGCDNFNTKYPTLGSACNSFKCNYYCSYHDDGIHSNMPYWGGCPESCPAKKGDYGTASGNYPSSEYIKAWGGKGCKDGKKCCPGSKCDVNGDCKPNN